jgi:superfamily II DNA or RNA helicase
MNVMQSPALIVPDGVLRDDDIRRSTGPVAMDGGQRLEAQGRVTRILVHEGGDRVEGEVQSASRRPYVQNIVLRGDAQGVLTIVGMCTCPRRLNCEHVAAVLIASRKRLRLEAAPALSPAEVPLSSSVAAWLHDLEVAERNSTEDYPPTIRKRLVYVLAALPEPSGAVGLAIQLMTVTLLKDDRFSQNSRSYRPSLAQGGEPAQFLRPSDQWILRRLSDSSVRCTLPPDSDVDVLQRMIATGRARWGSTNGPAVTEGPQRPGRIAWRLNEDGSQSPHLVLNDGGEPLLLPTPWYVDPATGVMGPVALDMSARLARRLLTAPPIPIDQAVRVRLELARRLPAVPAPEELAPPERVNGPPRPHLRLVRAMLPSPYGYTYGSRQAGDQPTPLARLSFDYGPVSVAPTQHRPVLTQNGRLYRVMRDTIVEAAASQRLSELGFRSASSRYYSYGVAHPSDLLLVEDQGGDGWLGFLTRIAPKLRAEGWQIEVANDFPLQLIEPDGDVTAELDESSGIDWLELSVGVSFEGQRVDLVPGLVKMIATLAGDDVLAEIARRRDDESFVAPLPDGRILVLPFARVRPLMTALAELFVGGGIDPDDGRVRFTRLDAADLAAFEQATPNLVWRGGEALRALGAQLREAGGAIPSATLPDGFAATLRPYQKQGVDWLQFLRAAALGGVLADDMGLGKTVQTLAHLAIEKAEGRLDRPSLVVCPTSVVPNWRMEAERFAPGLKVLVLHGAARKDHFDQVGAHDVVLTTYSLLTRDQAVLTAQDWHLLVLDEAQMIKNPAAEATRLVCTLRARQRLCLSGTPLQNHLGELWSLFDFLARGFLGSSKNFRTRYRTPIEKHGNAERQTLLNRRVRPFLLRRTKEEVALDLPEKTEIAEPVELGDAQRAIYEGIRLAMHERVRKAIAQHGLARSGIVILDALLKLRQACCDPRLLKLKAAQQAKAGSAKLDRLMELLPQLLDEGRRVLLFSQFTSMLTLIEQRLAAEQQSYVLLTGETVDRTSPVRRFQRGEVPLFLVSLKAGGVGLNLTAADTVIHYDPWWNPAAEDQATDRAHRIGQTKPVFVHRLITLGTIEEKMTVLKERKRALVAGILDAERGATLALTEADIETLFAPG